MDASTDFRQQALRHRIHQVDSLLVTHDHADHTNGFDDLRAINFLQKKPIEVYAQANVLETLQQRFAYCFNPVQKGGGVPQLNMHTLDPGKSIIIDGLEITPIPIKHGILEIFGYRFGSDFAYLSDCNEVPESSMPLFEGVRVLVVDALRHRQHSTHFNLEQALEFSQRVAPEQTWFTHMTCKLEHFATNASLPANAQLLHDNQIIEI